MLRRLQGRAEWALGRAHLAPLAVMGGIGRPPLARIRPAPSYAARQTAMERLRRHSTAGDLNPVYGNIPGSYIGDAAIHKKLSPTGFLLSILLKYPSPGLGTLRDS